MRGSLLQQLFNYYVADFDYLWDLSSKHLLMSVYGTLFAALIGAPLGILLARYTELSGFIIAIANIIQTVPAVAMLTILTLAMGLGSETVAPIVFLYALFPIIKNTCTGIASADASIRDVGKGMGMTHSRVLRMIELPLSVSVIIGSVRIALAVAVGVVAIGSFIGAPVLGDIVIRDTNATDSTTFILVDATPIATIVIVVDVLLGFLEGRLDPTAQYCKN